MQQTLLKYNIFSYSLLIFVIINLFNWQTPFLSMLFGGVFFIYQSLVWGDHMKENQPIIRRLILGFFSLIITLVITSGCIYLLGSLSKPFIACILLLLPIIGSLLQLYRSKSKQKSFDLHMLNWQSFNMPISTYILYGGLWFFQAALLLLLINAQTTSVISSPWTVLPNYFWALLFLSFFLAILTGWKEEGPKLNAFSWGIQLFIVLSIGSIIYKLGYGYDTFIHQATIESIFANGFILPKTPYYIGQYGLYITLHHLLGIPLQTIITFFPAFFASIIIPFAWREALGPQKGESTHVSRTPYWLSLIVLLTPITLLNTSTPYALGSIFYITLVILSQPLCLSDSKRVSLLQLLFIAFAICFIHPLIGIPALILLSVLFFFSQKESLQFTPLIFRLITLEGIIIGSFIIPLIFLANNLISAVQTSFTPFNALNLRALSSWWPISMSLSAPTYKTLFFESGYFIMQNSWIIICMAIASICLWALKRGMLQGFSVYLVTAFILALNAIHVSLFLNFPDIIDYEASDFPARLLLTAFWTLIPLLSLALLWMKKSLLRKQNRSIALFLIGAISWFACGTVFASYPRENTYEFSRQYNTSSLDLAAVEKIHSLSKNKDYIVLANQQVSAAAIKLYGFATYYQLADGYEQFYYPVPTSSPLYAHYLEMVESSATKKTAQKAADLAEVDTVYFVLNHYWDNANTINEQAKHDADDWITIENNITIFIYKFPQYSLSNKTQ